MGLVLAPVLFSAIAALVLSGEPTRPESGNRQGARPGARTPRVPLAPSPTSQTSASRTSASRALTLPPLPYSHDALQPWISSRTVDAHHDVHERAYVSNTNRLLSQIESSAPASLDPAFWRKLSFEASGALLHRLYWRNLTPTRQGGSPWAETDRLLTLDFGGLDRFRRIFLSIAETMRNPGWVVWCFVPEMNRSVLCAVSGHSSDMVIGSVPLLVFDTWEHAWYLDSGPDRGRYVAGFWGHVDWTEVERRVVAAL